MFLVEYVGKDTYRATALTNLQWIIIIVWLLSIRIIP